MDKARPSIKDLHARLSQGETKSVDLTQQSLDHAKNSDSLGTLFLSLREGRAMAAAEAADQRAKQGKRLGPLDGIPIAIKDNIVMKDEVATCGSQFLRDYVSPYDSHVVGKLKEAGAVIIGKTNLDEFAMGSSNEHSAYGVVRNPWDRDRVPGGSSGASAVCVAAGIAPLSLGSETGGSVRQPASFCGVVGVKPTYGRVSRYGLVAFASSLDQIGPFSWWVEDAALLLQVIAGRDERDSTSAAQAVDDYPQTIQKPIDGLRVGLVRDFTATDLDAAAEKNFSTAVEAIRGLGAKTVEVSLPHLKYAVGCYYVINSAEASANLARFDGVRYTSRSKDHGNLKDLFVNSRTQGFGVEVKRRIMLGTYVLSAGYYDAYYGKACKIRHLIREDFIKAFAKCDVILTPTSPCEAFPLGAKLENPLQMYLSDVFTASINLAGLPAVSVPSGFSEQGLPFGLQIIAPDFAEGRALGVAHHYQQSTDWKDMRP